MENFEPVALQKTNEGTLKILWSDKTSNEYDVRKLRYNCACAKCVNEWNGERIIKLESIAKNMKPVKIDSVGNYAIKITWTDGHDSGIYSYKNLKNILPALTIPEDCSPTPDSPDEQHPPHEHHPGCKHSDH